MTKYRNYNRKNFIFLQSIPRLTILHRNINFGNTFASDKNLTWNFYHLHIPKYIKDHIWACDKCQQQIGEIQEVCVPTAFVDFISPFGVYFLSNFQSLNDSSKFVWWLIISPVWYISFPAARTLQSRMCLVPYWIIYEKFTVFRRKYSFKSPMKAPHLACHNFAIIIRSRPWSPRE